MKKTERLFIRIDPDLKRAALAKSKETGIPVSFILTRALEQWTQESKP